MAQKRKQNKKWIYWLAFLGLLIVVGVVAFLVWKNYSGNEKKNDSVAVEAIERKETIKEGDTSEGQNELTEDEDGEKVKQYEGENPNKLDGLTGSITYAGVVDGKLMVRVNIDQFLNEGKCSLKLMRGGESIYDASTNIVSLVSTSTCDGFDIPAKDLGSGKALIVIHLSSGERIGEITSEVSL